MQTSKNKQRALLLILVFVFFVGGVFLCRWMLTPATLTNLVNYHLDQIDEAGENVDLVFVGGSRTYRSFDPDIFDKKLGIKNSLNNGSPAQRTIFSYYLLRETLNKYHPKYVVIGSTYNGMMYQQSPADMMYNIDRLCLKSQVEYATVQYGFQQGIQALTGKAQYLHYLWPTKMIKNVKDKYNYNRGISTDEKSLLKPNGYKGEHNSIEPGSVSLGYDETLDTFREKDIDPIQYEYYDKMIKLCKKKKVKVFLVSGPCTMMNIYHIHNYQGAVDFYANYAKENGVYYYNLNYLKDREKYMPDELFIDRLHLNYEGGQYASKMLAQIMKDELEGKDTSHYFYKDLTELEKSVHRIPSCAGKLTRQGDYILIQAKSLHNKKVVPQYRVLGYVEKTDKYEVVVGWSKKDEWKVPVSDLKKYKKVRIEASTREAGQPAAFINKDLKSYLEYEE